MICENYFCIYYSQGECILEETELDIMGCCKNCIYVTVPERELKKIRVEQLKKYDEEY